MSDDMEVFVVTGKPGEQALRWIRLDEAVERMMIRRAGGTRESMERWMPEVRAEVKESCERDLLAALGEGT